MAIAISALVVLVALLWRQVVLSENVSVHGNARNDVEEPDALSLSLSAIRRISCPSDCRVHHRVL